MERQYFLDRSSAGSSKWLCGGHICSLLSQRPVRHCAANYKHRPPRAQLPPILLTSSRWPAFGTSHPHALSVTAGGPLSQCLWLRLGCEL